MLRYVTTKEGRKKYRRTFVVLSREEGENALNNGWVGGSPVAA